MAVRLSDECKIDVSSRQLACNDSAAHTTAILSVMSDDIANGVKMGQLAPGVVPEYTYRPFSPKMSTKPSCTRSANPGYFCWKTNPSGNRRKQPELGSSRK